MPVIARPAPAAPAPTVRRLRAAGRSAAARVGRTPPIRWLDAHPLTWRLLGGAVLVAAAWHIVSAFLVSYPDEIWQVDLEVYREGAHSLVAGRQVYEWLTDAPQYLPFTYPPFAALVGIPLLVAPFRVVGWVWTGVQIALLWYCTGLAFRPLLVRAGARRGLLQGLVAAALVQLQPMQDGIRYGQVNAVLVALCLADVARSRAGWWPKGSLVGLATAIKLTPAVFWVHWAVTRRWRVLAVSVTAAVTATVVTALYAPSASMAYWTDALLDPNRLGPNADTANQSIRGVLLRLGPHQGLALTATWALCVLVVAVFGYWLSARLERMGEAVAVVAVMGMLAFLLSPVSWIHHMYWGLVAIGALLGDGRRFARIVAAGAVYAVLFSRLPWTGQTLVGQHGWRHVLGLVDQQAYCWLGLAVLVALWWLVARGHPADRGPARGGEAPDAVRAAIPDPDHPALDDPAVAGASRPPP
ncbi:MAG: glycosyltransferase 87 family protein [Kineosporiaceae bacterium]